MTCLPTLAQAAKYTTFPPKTYEPEEDDPFDEALWLSLIAGISMKEAEAHVLAHSPEERAAMRSIMQLGAALPQLGQGQAEQQALPNAAPNIGWEAYVKREMDQA